MTFYLAELSTGFTGVAKGGPGRAFFQPSIVPNHPKQQADPLKYGTTPINLINMYLIRYLDTKPGASRDPLVENPLESPLIPHVDTHDKVKCRIKFKFLKWSHSKVLQHHL